MQDVGRRPRARGDLLGAVCETGEVLGGAPGDANAGARLIRQRHLDLRATGKRLEQRPLRPGQVLEPVGEDGGALPGVELGGKALGGAAPQKVAVPVPQPVELVAVRAIERRQIPAEILRIDEARPELAEGVTERGGGPAGKCGARRTVQGNLSERPPHDQRPLRVGRHRPPRPREPLEQVVEGADEAAEQAAAARQRVPLDPVDVRPVRHDQCRFVVETRQIALEQKRYFPRVGGACDERESQPSDRRPAFGRVVVRPRKERVSRLGPRPRSSGGARGGRQRGPASRRRSRRRDRPPSSPGGRRRTSRAGSRLSPRRLPCRSCRRREWFSEPRNCLLNGEREGHRSGKCCR